MVSVREYDCRMPNIKIQRAEPRFLSIRSKLPPAADLER
jgi:hypothetical protein